MLVTGAGSECYRDSAVSSGALLIRRGAGVEQVGLRSLTLHLRRSQHADGSRRRSQSSHRCGWQYGAEVDVSSTDGFAVSATPKPWRRQATPSGGITVTVATAVHDPREAVLAKRLWRVAVAVGHHVVLEAHTGRLEAGLHTCVDRVVEWVASSVLQDGHCRQQRRSNTSDQSS
jgi:hypothetical protein